MDITEMLRKAQESGASDIFIIAGLSKHFSDVHNILQSFLFKGSVK